MVLFDELNICIYISVFIYFLKIENNYFNDNLLNHKS